MVPLGSASGLERAKTRKPTLMGHFSVSADAVL